MTEAATETWVFHGKGARHACAVFTSLENARSEIARHGLTGLLTCYPPDQLFWDWVQARGYWKPKSDAQADPEFKQSFCSAYAGHHHFENGQQVG